MQDYAKKRIIFALFLSLIPFTGMAGADATLLRLGKNSANSDRSSVLTYPQSTLALERNDEGPCSLSVNGQQHARVVAGETAYFLVDAGDRQLNVHWVGSMDADIDANGAYFGGVTPNAFYYTYTHDDLRSASVRRFTRYAILKDDAGNVQCTTNNIFVKLLAHHYADYNEPFDIPCSLRVRDFRLNAGDETTLTLDASFGYRIFWMGDRDGRVDAQAAHYNEVTPYNVPYQFGLEHAGRSGRSRYTRYALLKDEHDRIRCTTDNIVVNVQYSSLDNNTPFPSSRSIANAFFTTRRFNPSPENMIGDIHPTAWAGDGELYTAISDGIVNGIFGQHLIAKITGEPPNLNFTLVGRPDPLSLRDGYTLYGLGFTSIKGVFYATRTKIWDDALLGPFQGLEGIWWSRDFGQTWNAPPREWSFSARAGNLNWVMEGQDATNPDGYMYAISSDREANASHLFLGRVRPDDFGEARVPNPAHWQWYAGAVNGVPQWTADLGNAKSLPGYDARYPDEFWHHKITYPQMTYNRGLGRYLLVFSYSYMDDDPRPPDMDSEALFYEVWRGGMELVILESEHPWGPFSFVYRQPYWGPSNGYSGAFLIKWQSDDGRDLWLKWAANPAGCGYGLDCSGTYGFNMRKMRLDAPLP